MFTYFPKNQVWKLPVDLAIEMVGRIGKTEEMFVPLLAASEQPDAAGVRAFHETWACMADERCTVALEDEACGPAFSAGEKYSRISVASPRSH